MVHYLNNRVKRFLKKEDMTKKYLVEMSEEQMILCLKSIASVIFDRRSTSNLMKRELRLLKILEQKFAEAKSNPLTFEYVNDQYFSEEDGPDEGDYVNIDECGDRD